jgi:hypothetical protein
MVCKNTGDLYWFGSKNALRLVGKVRVVLSYTKVFAVGLQAGERRRSSQVSRCELSVCVTLLVPSQGPGELPVRLPRVPETVPVCSFYSLKEVQGYKMLVRGVTLVGEGAQRPQEGLIRWRRGPHCGGMPLVLLALLLHVQACAPLLREWFLSSGVVVMRSVIPGPVVGMACSSL